MSNVNSPNHYTTTSLECIDAMEMAFGVEATMKFAMINAFKYIWRHKEKNGVEDLEKAMWYCNYWFKKYEEWYNTNYPLCMEDEQQMLAIRNYAETAIILENYEK